MPREDRPQTWRETPSFSLSLLDAIYRSIDESNGSNRDVDMSFRRDKTTVGKKKQSSTSLKQELNNSFQPACMIEKCMQQKKGVNSGGCEIKAFGVDPMLLNSSSSSPDSSCCGGFSSSESDSFYSAKSRSSASTCYGPKPKPIRSSNFPEPKHELLENNVHGGFIRTKSKAMKIFSDLKKVKQPISPGGKLASFINSLFTSRSPKKTKKSKKIMWTSEQPTSTYSSASSFSRSCLSTTKTSSSKGNSGTKTKRSVRFCPVSVILDEDSSRPCGELKIRHANELQASMRKPVMNKEIEYHIIEESRRVAEAARELLNSYRRKPKNEEFDMRDIDDDDAASYASSDLFELDNLSAIGNERFLEELPVYETTHFDTNRAIAKGLIL